MRSRTLFAGMLVLAGLMLGLVACGGDDSTNSEDVTLDLGLVTKNLSDAEYDVQDVEPGKGQLPGVVDVDFATGSDSGFEGALQISGNGLEPFAGDPSKTGYAVIYSDADKATKADDSIGDGKGQQREGNVLFLYGSGLDAPPTAFTEMITAAEGQ